MSEIRHRDPILDPPRNRKGLTTAWTIGVAFSLAINGAIAFFVLNQKFKLIPILYHDEKVNVTLEKLPPPPPPPPKKPPPPPPPKAPPPPTIAPREVKVVTNVAPPAFPPLQTVHAEPKIAPTPVLAPPPPAPPAPPRPSVITNPQWIRLPDASDLDRYYPPQAKEAGIEGRATVNCVVKEDGTLTSCEVVSEEPAGKGFGSATVRAASRFKMRPKTVDGQPVGGAHVNVPMRWRLNG
jgi:protein TonB